MANPDLHYGKWRIRWTDEHGKRHSECFTDKRDATFTLRQRQTEVEEVKRGLRSPRLYGKTFNDLCDYWLANRAVLKRSARSDRSIIERHLRPAFGSLDLRRLGTAEADQYVATRTQVHRKTMANHLTLLIAMLNHAHDLKWINEVPRIRKPRIPLFTHAFNYLRTDEEITRFLLTALREGEHVYMLYLLAIYTGLREGEIACLRWDCVDFTRRLITVQRSFNGPTKAENVRYVPILDPLLAPLREWKLKMPGDFVFTNEAGHRYTQSARIFQEVLHRVLDAAGFPKTERNGKLRPYIRFHDLRHTFASYWVRQGGDMDRLRRILGHKSSTMTQRYAHLAPEAYASDYARLGTSAPGYLRADVLPLPTRKS
jgi:integrase